MNTINFEEGVKAIREIAAQIIETYDFVQKYVVFYARTGNVINNIGEKEAMFHDGDWARGEHNVIFIEQVYPQIVEFLVSAQLGPEKLGQIIWMENLLSDQNTKPLKKSPKELYHYVRWYLAGISYHWCGPYCPNLLTGQRALIYLAGYGLLIEVWRQLEEEVTRREERRRPA
jgi:hypothetical protein